MSAWMRSGWVTEYPTHPDRDALVDYICKRCGTRVGVPQHLADDSDLLRRILKTANCRCNKKTRK